MSITFCIIGAAGRMGKEIVMAASVDDRFSFVSACDVHAVGEDIGDIAITDDIVEALSCADVAIDFATADGVAGRIASAVNSGTPYVIGTTGLSGEDINVLKEASSTIPIVYATNFSIGITMLLNTARDLATKLPKSFDIEIVEAHHTKKKDAPSGTALTLASAINAVRGGNIPVHAIRAGDIVGDHTIILAGPGERIEIKHQAHSRATFANGALTAAAFLVGKTPGLYTMDNVLEH
ncbi:MAG: 4-hydroxy-tetrahydrodipicolinate reductase [Waddliaceae bacterium]|nr:4-hydroxy-tetrahydrodipicolinate reductase [Waddliaceae bacterium]MBT3578966.1 4-hydroxy-tetrahydrodipicolinate reductase [Waddliaceae bacterium]MBT4445101.1 4-hydroxy-tetrahydrodipicolinate reductase [Waddliaceae bacterium]MBT6928966.1 4-hydroxy-tetrahydrodipicolinate reductase [Waddliaceae bacterium]MBT7264538.1 4-hydroxy-tetrahydrodipicolinate reductase [Waddliaceae bacterium]